jgi:processive 1,2-diacylglycerol beta-glucosyltransferase
VADLASAKPTEPQTQLLRVLIISASMGAGHDGAAKELAARLRADGHEPWVRDFLDAGPLRLGKLLRLAYEFEIRKVPSAYDATYRIWYRVPWLCPVVTWLVTALTRRRVLRWVKRGDAQVVVSTYPLATLSLGRLRSIGQLRIPALNFITDFGVHPLWVHRGIDLNLAVHQGPADMARRQSGRPSFACGPMVSELYDPVRAASPEARAASRRQLGLGAADRGVLIVAGSWGVGSVETTFRAVASSGRYVPIVVCGRDEVLRSRLELLSTREGLRAEIIGWTDKMPELMAGSDALVENAGGLTSLEALRIGLPVVSYDPIAGHGKENTAAMAAAGISQLAGTPAQLIDVLDLVTANGEARATQVEAGRAMFVADGAKFVAGAGQPTAVAALAAPNRARVVWASASRGAVGVLAVLAIGWGGLTTGVNLSADAGAGVARPATKLPAAYVGVRLNATELSDAAVRKEIEQLDITVIVDGDTAVRTATQLRDLAVAGVNIENGGHGAWYDRKGKRVEPALWTRAKDDASAGHTLASLINEPVKLLVPGRRINGFDLIDCDQDHERLVVADIDITAGRRKGDAPLPKPTARQIVLVNGMHATPAQLDSLLNQLATKIGDAHLLAAPLSAMQ